MLNYEKVLIAWLCFLFILLIGFGFYAHKLIKDTVEEADDAIDEHIEKQEAIEREVVSFVKEFTGNDTEFVSLDGDTYLIKAGRDLYTVLYDKDLDTIKFMIHKDEVVYEWNN